MNLPRFSIYPPEDPSRPDRHVQHRFTSSVLSSLFAHSIEDPSSFMIAVVIELEPILARVAEDPLVYCSDRFPAASNTAHRIVITASSVCAQFRAMSSMSRLLRA